MILQYNLVEKTNAHYTGLLIKSVTIFTSLLLCSKAGNYSGKPATLSPSTFYSSHTEHWGGRCKQRGYECFTLCWMGSLGHRSPAWVLFTALPAHEVSLPGLEQGQSSSVSPVLSQDQSWSGQPCLTVGPVKTQMAALPPTNTAVFHWVYAQSSGSKSVTFWEFFFITF